jgi:hypothetical protein
LSRQTQRLVICARLRPGNDEAVAELIRAGPPFDPGRAGFARHTVYQANDEVVFVFEGRSVDQLIGQIINNPARIGVVKAWAPLLAGRPRIAREVYHWEAQDTGGRIGSHDTAAS